MDAHLHRKLIRKTADGSKVVHEGIQKGITLGFHGRERKADNTLVFVSSRVFIDAIGRGEKTSGAANGDERVIKPRGVGSNFDAVLVDEARPERAVHIRLGSFRGLAKRGRRGDVAIVERREAAAS